MVQRQNTRKIQDYALLQVVGSGNFADAWSALDQEDAVKCLKVFKDDHDDSFNVECDVGRMALQHEHIMQIYGAGVDDLTDNDGNVLGKKQYIVNEFCPNGSLYELITQPEPLEVDVARALFL
jgi:serine/threonine protein kinase